MLWAKNKKSFIALVCFLFFELSLSCPCGKNSILVTKTRPKKGAKSANSSDSTDRIVGGTLSQQNAWPWVVSLVNEDRVGGSISPFCGGSIINYNYVLTAAHCVYDIIKKGQKGLANLRIYAGDVNLVSPNIKSYAVSTIKMHPEYNPKTTNNDIALIKINTKFVFSDRTRAICLAQQTGDLTGMPVIVAGWGSLKSGGSSQVRMSDVKVNIIDTSKCAQSYAATSSKITPATMLCASGPNKDSCQGDSGGPLFAQRKSSSIYEQVGVVSFGIGCADKKFPGVYARVSNFLSYIAENTKDAQKC